MVLCVFQVMLPQYSEDTDKMVKIPPTPSHLTPSLVSGIHGNDLNSPITHHERYSSPPAGSKMAACPTTPVSPSQSSSVIVTGQTVVTMASATVTTNNGQSVTIPVRGKYLLSDETQYGHRNDNPNRILT